MDPALKKRLLGAALLIVLAIIFVPMLFTGRPHERTETVDLNLPKPPDRDFTTRTVPLATTPRPAPSTAPDAVATVDTEKHPDSPAPPVEPAPKPAPPPSEPDSKAPGATIAAAVAKPANGAQSPPTRATSAPVKAEQTSEGVSEHGRYGVSFGTYSKPENADKLVADLKRVGVAAYAEPVEVKGESALRVRSGPYLDRSQAEKARLLARGARADVPGRLIELDDTTAPSTAAASVAAKPVPPPPAPAGKPRAPAPTPPATAVTGWAVQIGAYQNETDANGRRDALRKAGFSAYVEPVKTQKGKLYRLRVGPATERAGADKLRAELKEKMKLDGTVVQEP